MWIGLFLLKPTKLIFILNNFNLLCIQSIYIFPRNPICVRNYTNPPTKTPSVYVDVIRDRLPIYDNLMVYRYTTFIYHV